MSKLDSILALTSRMAYGLERFTSTEASLVLAGLMLARQQILQSLIYYMLRRHWAALVQDHRSLTTHHSYVTSVELGRAWFQHHVRGQTLMRTLPIQQRLLKRDIEKALLREWQQRWSLTMTGRQLFDIMGIVGSGWLPRDVVEARRETGPRLQAF